ncbi:MAG: 4Fe-4S dicluster domain-containing protein [Candidatus Bathyarchaeia archaeon]
MAITKLDPKFKEEVSKLPGGQNLKRCFQCGTCNVGCPVREINEKYNPRKIIRMVILGMKDRVLSSEFIWLCSLCFICQERCPQDVRIPEVMDAIKNMAVREGYIHSTFAKQAETIGKLGILYAISDFENKRRIKRGLPKLPSQNLEVPEIYRMTGLDKLLTKKEDV